jgi:hypothetical protein
MQLERHKSLIHKVGRVAPLGGRAGEGSRREILPLAREGKWH